MKAIGYYRVSTGRQGRSGLGLEAQQEAVRAFCLREGIELLSEAIEVETGAGSDALDKRPVLASALTQAKRQNAALIVAKLDRLSRDVCFISGLMSQKVSIVIADLGIDADPFVMHIMASLAQKERAMISQRTKAALQAAKARGVTLGNLESLPEAQRRGHETMQKHANAFAERLAPIVNPMLAQGVSYREIARKLEAMGIQTSRNGKWTPVQVSSLAKRLETLPNQSAA